MTNLRVVAGSEGPNDAPYRMVAALQTAPGVYDEQVYFGLDVLLAEMGKRGMRAVMCLTNFWQWSGGMAQYVSWAEGGTAIPYPDQGDWDGFQNYVARFYVNDAAKAMYRRHVVSVVQRTNSVTGVAYRDDPTIMAWQLANEPRGINQADAFVRWVRESAVLIRSLDANHLITTGSEGKTPYDGSQTRFEEVHAIPEIDYTTFHIWVQNWNWYDPRITDPYAYGGYEYAKRLAMAYMHDHTDTSARLGKPSVMEEFGISRDGGDFAPGAGTSVRDRYYAEMFAAVYEAAQAGKALVGVNFWAWSGEGRPVSPGGIWRAGDPWTGDPPHEPQGWYSVYDRDTKTNAIIQSYAEKMNAL